MAFYKNIKYVVPETTVETTDGISILSDVDTVTNAPEDGQILVYSNSQGKWLPANIPGVTLPTISSISPTSIDNSQTTINITGSNFSDTPQVELFNPSTGIYYLADSVTFNNSTSLSIAVTLSSYGSYKIRVENGNGNSVLSSTSLLTVSQAPTYSTAAGTIGTVSGGDTVSLSVSASSDSAVSYSITSGSLPGGLSLNSSTGAITGTETGATAETTYNFTITATDAESQTAVRSFSITVEVGATGSAQFN